MILSLGVKAQWSFGPIAKYIWLNPAYLGGPYFGDGFADGVAEGKTYLQFIFPAFCFNIDYYENSDVSDWMNQMWGAFSVGYRMGCLPENFPIGFEANLEYSRNPFWAFVPGYKGEGGFWLSNSDKVDYTKCRHVKNMINPTLIMQCRLGSMFSESKLNYLLFLGTTYDYTFKFSTKKLDTPYATGCDLNKSGVNNGFNLIFGTGLLVKRSGMVYRLKYHRQCYDMFDPSYNPEHNLHINDQTRRGSFVFEIVFYNFHK